MENTMSTMRAFVLRNEPQSCSVEDYPLPQPAHGMARVRLMAAALNRRDVWIRDGKYAQIVYPVVPGSDGAGVVDAVADDNASDWLGRAVIINPNINWGSDQRTQSPSYSILGMPTQGCCAEYVCVPYDRLVDKPEHLSFSEAAALPLAGLTAYRALVSQAGIRTEEKLLVTGIGGGVALLLMHFAKAYGAIVYVSSTDPLKIERALKMGASGGVCTTNSEWMKELAKMSGGIDCAVDSVGGDLMNGIIQLINPGGRIVSYGATLGAVDKVEIRRIFWKQLHWMGSTMGSDRDFHEMVDCVRTHHIVPTVDSQYDLEHAADAFDYLKSSRQFGKVVLKIAKH